jgi:spore coat protein H
MTLWDGDQRWSKNMNWQKIAPVIALISLAALISAGCGGTGDSSPVTTPLSYSSGQPANRSEVWSDESHSNDADPDYNTVFPQDKVHQMKITISPDDWADMQANMTDLFGEKGTGQGGALGFGGVAPGNIPRWDGAAPDGGNVPQWGGVAPQLPGDNRQGGGMFPGAGALPGGGGDMTPENPMWVPATIEFNGLTWTNVGVRYKGNSSLTSGWKSGTLKLPLKLDFDEFEDEYPEIENQRFYGFKQLSLSNAFSDATYMRDAISADILAEAGLVAAETAYYEIILDYGEGPVDLGLYVMIEVIDDTVIERVFDDGSGNIYEGDGAGVSLAQGTFSQIPTSFVKENNRAEADWSDIEALYNAIHSPQRTSDPAAWRQNLESLFDVDTFLEWLAISGIIQNWDSYGRMSHNFYLYHDPDTGLLTWISWDHNMVLGVGGGEGRGGLGAFGGGIGGNISLDRDEVGQNWPLIRFLLDDPVYYKRYVGYIAESVNGAFNPDKLEKKIQHLAGLISTYVANESSETSFQSAVRELINNIQERYQVAADFLAAEK